MVERTRDGSRVSLRVEDLSDEEIEMISRATITEGESYDLDDLDEDGTMKPRGSRY